MKINYINLNKFWTKVGFNLIWENDSMKPLGITFDKQLKFDDHMSLLCTTANRRLCTIASITQKTTLSL